MNIFSFFEDTSSSDFLIALSANAVYSITYLILTLVVIKAFHSYKKRRVTGLSQFAFLRSGLNSIRIVYGLISENDRPSLRSLEEGDVAALSAMLSLLEEKFDRRHVGTINASAATRLIADNDAIVSISGPFWNPVTRLLLGRLGSPVWFSRSRECVEAQSSKQIEAATAYRTEFRNQVPRVCYAVVCVGKIDSVEAARPTIAVVAAGSSSLGTYGAVIWLRRLANVRRALKEVPNFYRTSSCNAVLLRVSDNSPEGFTAYASAVDNPDYLDISVLTYFRESDFWSSYEYVY